MPGCEHLWHADSVTFFVFSFLPNNVIHCLKLDYGSQQNLKSNFDWLTPEIDFKYTYKAKLWGLTRIKQVTIYLFPNKMRPFWSITCKFYSQNNLARNFARLSPNTISDCGGFIAALKLIILNLELHYLPCYMRSCDRLVNLLS